MTTTEKRKSFIDTYLTPVDSLSEIVFGLIMVLGFTSTASLAFGGQFSDQFVWAVLGCNLAWGIVDGVMYVLTSVYERAQRSRLADSVRKATDEAAAMAVVGEAVEEAMGRLLSDDRQLQVSRWVMEGIKTVEPQKARITQEDLMGALASGLLVFLATLPVAIPFFLISDATQALRVSNVICVASLFVVGYQWAALTHANRVIAGLSLMTIGLVMVAITVALGG